MYDLIIIGAGPAGLTSALYALRANKKVLILEAKNYGGQIINASNIENYPGIISISGFDFATNLYNQVKKLGGEIVLETVVHIEEDKKVVTNKNEYQAKAIIIATGSENRKLNIEHEQEFIGHGVSYWNGYHPTFLLGARSSLDLLQLGDFQKFGQVYITTEDGSVGEKGYVTQHSILFQETFDMIYTCGPRPMMMSVAQYAQTHQIECEVSLENKMACGVGACLCCVENTNEGHLCVCKEGPVFNIKQLLWQI